MFEFLFGAVLVSLYLPRRARKKLEKANKLAGTGKKVRGLDADCGGSVRGSSDG